MQTFLLRYLLIGMAGSTLIYLLAPMLPPELAVAYVRTVDSARSVPTVDRFLSWVQHTGPGLPAPAPDTAEPAHPPDPVTPDARPTPPVATAPQPLTPAVTPTAPVVVAPPSPTLPAATPPPAGVTPTAPPPAARPNNPLPREGVGVVRKSDASLYSVKGKFVRTIPTGTFLLIDKVEQTQEGPMAVCIAEAAGVRQFFAVHGEDIEILEPQFVNADESQRQLVRQRAQLLARVDDLKRDSSTAVRKDNPHAAEYVKIREKFQAYNARVKELRDKFEASEGGNREALGDELREMRGDGFTLGDEYKQARDAYVRWNQSHPATSQPNPEIARLEKQVSEIERDLGLTINQR